MGEYSKLEWSAWVEHMLRIKDSKHHFAYKQVISIVLMNPLMNPLGVQY